MFIFQGSTLLIDAVKRSDGFSAQFLLDNSCDVNLIDRNTADTALHLVCTYAEKSSDARTYKEMLIIGEKLLEHDANPNIQNQKG